ncbi:MAG: VOC family protein [Bacteroidota bacterium]
MKKSYLFLFAMLGSFCFGITLQSIVSNQMNRTAKKRVTGIGGVFFKCKDPKKLRSWYQKHLGLSINDYGSVFEWFQGADSTKKGFTQWSPFDEKTNYFSPSTKDFMINYRVEDLENLIIELKKEGVTVLDSVERYDYGKFVHILDLEKNKIELWEPNDIVYEKMGQTMGVKTTK